MYPMAKAWRGAVALAAAGAAVFGTAAGTQAAERAEGAEAFSFTPEKYSAVKFGTSRAEVREFLQVGATKPGSGEGWCEEDGSILCLTGSGDWTPYGIFAFNADDKLISKQQTFLYKPKTPSMTLAKYNQVKIGMTAQQLWSIVSQDSCVVSDEKYADWPATTNHQLTYECTAKTGLFPPTGWFNVVDGKVTNKYHRSLS
jgi:hypothetical protein